MRVVHIDQFQALCDSVDGHVFITADALWSLPFGREMLAERRLRYLPYFVRDVLGYFLRWPDRQVQIQKKSEQSFIVPFGLSKIRVTKEELETFFFGRVMIQEWETEHKGGV